MNSVTKPVVFISSTIYDFRDLRSALKFWLEELGYEVMLSDFNDFTKPLDENSYTACLKSIERANHFILLIGARTGGLFDASKKVSITRMEYRTAYDMVKAGRMKLITFVREDLWSVREDRKALKSLLVKHYAEEKELSDAEIAEIAKHPSTFVNDAEATFDFLHEVGRIDEMKQAIAGKTSFPIGNWIHPFSSFQDIVDTLSTVLDAKRSLSKIALAANLERELLYNLTELTFKSKDGDISFNTFYGDLARSHYKGKLKDSSTMPARYVKWMVMYLIASANGRKLSTQFIDQALTSGAFLEYDFNLNSYQIGAIHSALFQLKENISRFKLFSDAYFKERLNTFLTKYAPINNPLVKSDGNLTVNNEELLPVFACFDCEQNIARLCAALVNALNGNSKLLSSLKLNPSSPAQDESEKIKAETPTIEEIAAWVESSPTVDN